MIIAIVANELVWGGRDELEKEKEERIILDWYIVHVGSARCIFRIGFLVPPETTWESSIRALGKPAQVILDNGGFQARKYAREHPGDWVACSIEPENGDTVRLWEAEFAFVYRDTVIHALEYMSTESMFEFELYTKSDLIQFPGNVRPRNWGGFAIWLRFPSGTFERMGILATRGYAFEAPESVVVVNHWKN